MLEGFQTTRIEVNGVGLHVVHGGTGPAVLLLHGYPQTHVMWHKVAPDLPRAHARRRRAGHAWLRRQRQAEGGSRRPRGLLQAHHRERSRRDDGCPGTRSRCGDRAPHGAFFAEIDNSGQRRYGSAAGRKRPCFRLGTGGARRDRPAGLEVACASLPSSKWRTQKFLHQGAWSQCRNFPPYNFVPLGRDGCP